MIRDEIKEKLFSLQDREYGAFSSKLNPALDPSFVIGVRTLELRKYAKELVKREDLEEFLSDLPHEYFDENQLHAFVISDIKDYGLCIDEVERFLPFVDNWATCDQMSPKVFKKHKEELIGHIWDWLSSGKTYSIRFAVGMLMQHYLDDAFDSAFPDVVSAIRSEEYYVNMMKAWYFATALAKRWDEALPYIEGKKLDPWTHNKAIQKAVESYRISPEQKEYLKSLKLKKAN